MLELHEFYFGKTLRERYVAQIEGSNLVREIQATLNRQTAGCQRAPLEYKFVGLVGHDTNLATVGSLLGLRWKFVPPALPVQDALPGGALVFELRRIAGTDYVRAVYVTQNPAQIRAAQNDALRLTVGCYGMNGRYHPVCVMPLRDFNEIVRRVVATEFLSACVDGKQVCPRPPTAARIKRGKKP